MFFLLLSVAATTNYQSGLDDLEVFPSRDTNSPWAPALNAVLGRHYLETGRITLARMHLKPAWAATRDYAQPMNLGLVPIGPPSCAPGSQPASLESRIAPNTLPPHYFKYLSNGGFSRSLISGCSMFSGVTSTTPVSIRFSTFSPCRCFTIVITER
jgi:hypothetical protein